MSLDQNTFVYHEEPTDFLDPHPEDQLPKILRAHDVVALGFGAIIGFGWVVLTGDWINQAGTFGAVVALMAGGLIMGIVGLTYAELTAAMPKAGGEYNYLLRAFGSRICFIGSWAIAGGYASIVAFEAVALPRTISYLFPQVNSIPLWEVAGDQVYLVWALLGSAAAVAITILNAVGIRQVGVAQNWVLSFLVLVGIILVVTAFFKGEPARMEPFFSNGLGGMFSVLTVVPFLFAGFNVIPQAAEESIVKPRRIGWLVVVTVGLATLWYVVIVLATSLAMSGPQLKNTDIAVADALSALFGHPFWGTLIICGGIAGIITSWISLLLGASRILYVMGRAQMIPAWFGRLNPKYRTPVNAIAFIGGLSVIAPFFGKNALGWLVDGGSALIIVTYALVVAGFIQLRRREPNMIRPFSLGSKPVAYLIGGLALLACLWIFSLYLPGQSSALSWQSWTIALTWAIIGLFFLFRVPKVSAGPQGEAQINALSLANFAQTQSK